MFVVATAGHVDHGKSTLVRALTGTDPDRLAEERRRGLTIELGYAWTDLPTGERIAFVDVPGHERFLGTMLAGVGPVPAVLLVIAADEGWRRQTAEHVLALDALGVSHGVLAVTRADLADPTPAIEQARKELAGTSLEGIPVVAVSGRTGAGLDELRVALGRLVRELPAPPATWRTRLFVDRVFTIRGAGTVVTGTLPAGSVQVGDVLAAGPDAAAVTVRGLESCKERHARLDAVSRVAVNLRGAPGSLRRGDALLTPGAWPHVETVDVALRPIEPEPPRELVLHVGSAAVPVAVRPLADRWARLRLGRPLPLEPGDRGVLRDPGRHAVVAGVTVLDVDPPPLERRGAARERARELSRGVDAAAYVRRRGLVRRLELAVAGLLAPGAGVPADLRVLGAWVVDPAAWAALAGRLTAAVDSAGDRLGRGIPAAEAAAALGLGDQALLAPLVADAGLVLADARVRAPAAAPRVPASLRPALAALTDHLAADAFRAPEAADIAGLGLTGRDLGALAALGVLLRLPGDVVLLPDAPSRAAAILRELDQPFSLSAARQALGTTRRVAVPLLEHLDRLRLTVREPDSRRRAR